MPHPQEIWTEVPVACTKRAVIPVPCLAFRLKSEKIRCSPPTFFCALPTARGSILASNLYLLITKSVGPSTLDLSGILLPIRTYITPKLPSLVSWKKVSVTPPLASEFLFYTPFVVFHSLKRPETFVPQFQKADLSHGRARLSIAKISKQQSRSFHHQILRR